ncbi:MAG: ABC transporter ATP-binding protein, partial [Elusimicrobiaceae bacterium]
MGEIKTAGVGFAYNGVETLRNVSLRIAKGSHTVITGPNGAGKSTLLKIMAGILQPKKGNVQLKGRELSAYPQKEKARLLAYVPSELNIPYNFSVRDMVLIGRAPHLKWWRGYGDYDFKCADKITAALGLTDVAHRPANSLSSGERQKVILAQALAQEPELLLLDEPTAHLDISRQTEVFEILSGLSSKGITVVSVTHDITLAARYCDSVLLLKDGTVYGHGGPAEIISETSLLDVYGIKTAIRKNGQALTIDILGTR